MANETQKGDAAEGVGGGATSADPESVLSAAPAAKRAYSAPQLKRLGSVAELTFGVGSKPTDGHGGKVKG